QHAAALRSVGRFAARSARAPAAITGAGPRNVGQGAGPDRHPAGARDPRRAEAPARRGDAGAGGARLSRAAAQAILTPHRSQGPIFVMTASRQSHAWARP